MLDSLWAHEHLAREGVKVTPDAVELVVESLIAEVDRELKSIIDWEKKEGSVN